MTSADERAVRDEFEALVCRVAMAFRAEGRIGAWRSDRDLRTWHEEHEMS